MKAKVFQEHLEKNIIPFWNRMVDNENGGFYGYAYSDGNPDKNSVKGCILNSRILWFHSASYQLLEKQELLEKLTMPMHFFLNIFTIADTAAFSGL